MGALILITAHQARCIPEPVPAAPGSAFEMGAWKALLRSAVRAENSAEAPGEAPGAEAEAGTTTDPPLSPPRCFSLVPMCFLYPCPASASVILILPCSQPPAY